MPKTLTQIERDALTLSEQNRATLVQHLLETLDEGQDENVEEIWLTEAERRYEEYKKGNMKAFSAKQAFKEARNRLG